VASKEFKPKTGFAAKPVSYKAAAHKKTSHLKFNIFRAQKSLRIERDFEK